ncbi:MAG: hypothetical protein ACRDKV_03560, partial [Solirubrobacterales bacterium]
VETSYEAGGAYATLDGRGTIRVAADDRPGDEIAVDGARLHELAVHPRHESHRLRVDLVDGEVSIWSLSFAPGVP